MCSLGFTQVVHGEKAVKFVYLVPIYHYVFTVGTVVQFFVSVILYSGYCFTYFFKNTLLIYCVALCRHLRQERKSLYICTWQINFYFMLCVFISHSCSRLCLCFVVFFVEQMRILIIIVFLNLNTYRSNLAQNPQCKKKKNHSGCKNIYILWTYFQFCVGKVITPG